MKSRLRLFLAVAVLALGASFAVHHANAVPFTRHWLATHAAVRPSHSLTDGGDNKCGPHPRCWPGTTSPVPPEPPVTPAGTTSPVPPETCPPMPPDQCR